MKRIVIAMTGFASTGKDTVADLLVQHLGFRKLAFADALRAEVSNGFDIELSYLAHPSTKNHPMSALAMRKAPIGFLAAVTLATGNIPRDGDGRIDAAWLDQPRSPRQILQWWGTEYRRRQHEHYWSRQLLQRVLDDMRDGVNRFVITDCRFQNEADTVRTLGGQIWQVTRPGVDGATTTEGAHVSATDGAEFSPDLVINNDHDIGHLQQLVFDEFLALETGHRPAVPRDQCPNILILSGRHGTLVTRNGATTLFNLGDDFEDLVESLRQIEERAVQNVRFVLRRNPRQIGVFRPRDDKVANPSQLGIVKFAAASAMERELLSKFSHVAKSDAECHGSVVDAAEIVEIDLLSIRHGKVFRVEGSHQSPRDASEAGASVSLDTEAPIPSLGRHS